MSLVIGGTAVILSVRGCEIHSAFAEHMESLRGEIRGFRVYFSDRWANCGQKLVHTPCACNAEISYVDCMVHISPPAGQETD